MKRLSQDNIAPFPAPGEFDARHLGRWLGGQADLERQVLDWLVRNSRRLDGLPEGGWEWVAGKEEERKA
jgi:hypothetical protein